MASRRANTYAPRLYASQIAKILVAAAGEALNLPKWARVNRAAGILVGIVVVQRCTESAAAEQAQVLVDLVREELRSQMDDDTLGTMIDGLAKRVARGLVEFYGEGRS